MLQMTVKAESRFVSLSQSYTTLTLVDAASLVVGAAHDSCG